jgi:hypothetical protein
MAETRLKPVRVTLQEAAEDDATGRGSGSRALEVANQVLLDLAARGYDAELESPREPIHWIDFKPIDPKTKADCYPWGWWSPHRATVIHIGTVAIGLSFYEIKEEVRAKRVRNEWVPVEEEPELPHRGRRNAYQQDLRNMPGGRLAIRAFSPYGGTTWEHRWCEAKAGEWSTTVPSIHCILELSSSVIAEMVEKAWKKEEEERLRREAEWERYRIREELRKREEARLAAIRQREKAIADSRQELISLAEDWILAKRIEEFFSEVLQRSASESSQCGLSGNALNADWVADHLKRARELLGGTDALARFRTWRTPEER